MLRRSINWIAYRTTHRGTNVIKTGLDPAYYDKDTLMLHGSMQLLVDYVEVELASCLYRYSETEKSFIKRLGDRMPWFLVPKCLARRSREDGLKHIKEMTENTEIHEDEAVFYNTVKEIYLWWVDLRPNRPSPEDASGFNDIFDSCLENGFSPEGIGKAAMLAEEIECTYTDEDDAMLVKLIGIRRYMWT